MKYLTYLISLIFVLAIIGCGKPKEAKTEVSEPATEAVEETTEAVDATADEATQALEKVTE